jgi:hypothetical protein
MNKSSQRSIVGGFGALGISFIFFSIFLYIIYGGMASILPAVLICGTIGFVFLISAIIISFKKVKL